MVVRLRFPTANARRQVAGRRQFASSHAPASSKTGATTRPSRSSKLGAQGPEYSRSASESHDLPVDPPIPDTPTFKLFSLPTKGSVGMRPKVKPPPTLAFPPSMHPPPPRAFPETLPRRTSDTSERTYDIYMKSLQGTYTEPTLADLDALRPPPSTLRAALDGVIGSGRSLLPEDHELHLAVEQLGAQEASVGGGPRAKKIVVAGSRKAKKLEYSALYQATEGLVARGFTFLQLKHLERESRIERDAAKPVGLTTKPKIIHHIMNTRWNMIHPLVIKKYLAQQNEKSEQVHPVSPSELFIFLGHDGENLLHLAEELKMYITVDRESPETSADSKQAPKSEKVLPRSRFVIRASGTAQNHERLKKHLEEQRSLMTRRTVVLPTGLLLSPALLQSISRVSDAFVENTHTKFGGRKETENSEASVLITARNARSAYTAERLVQRAAMEDAHRSQIPLFSLTRPSETELDIFGTPELSQGHEIDAKYALYPFSTHGFRIRQVQHENNLQYDSMLHTIGSQGQERVVGSDEALILTGKERQNDNKRMVASNLKDETIDLHKYIFGEIEGFEGGKRKIIATYGHITFQAAGPSAFISPLPDPVSRKSVLEWAEKQETKSRLFIPGQVPPITRSVSDRIISVHRLQYRTIEGGHVINVDVELPSDNVEPVMIEHDAASAGEAINTADPTDRLELTPDGFLEGGEQPTAESALEDQHGSSVRGDETESKPAGVQEKADTSSGLLGNNQTTESVKATDEPAQESASLPTEITVGTEIALELLLPDSTMDMYLQVSNVSPLSSVPESLKAYLDALSTFFTTDTDTPQPDPPQSLSIESRDYMLVKNTSSRYGVEPSITDLPAGCVVAKETSLDLENNSRTAFTQLVYDGTGGPDDWEGFMRACQSLASMPYERSSELRVNPT